MDITLVTKCWQFFFACLHMVRTAQDKKDNPGGHPLPAAPGPAPAASNATSGAVPAASGAPSVAVPSVSVVTSQMKPLCTSDSVAQFNGTGDPLLVYTPDGGFTNDDSILAASTHCSS